MPIGLYRLQPTDRLFVTELVAGQATGAACDISRAERLSAGGVPMLKRVLALPGQTVCRTGLTITVDEI